MRCAAIAITLLLTVPAGAATYSDSERHWQFQYPDDWTLFDSATLAWLNAQVPGAPAAPKFRFVLGLKAPAPHSDDPPYLLVQVSDSDLGNLTYGEIEKVFSAQRVSGQKPTNAPPGAATPIFSTTMLDRSRNCVVGPAVLTDEQGGTSDGLVLMYFGRDSLVQFNCYSAGTLMSNMAPRFESIAKTFAFDPGFEYAEPDRFLGKALSALAAGVGVGTMLKLWLIRRKLRGEEIDRPATNCATPDSPNNPS